MKLRELTLASAVHLVREGLGTLDQAAGIGSADGKVGYEDLSKAKDNASLPEELRNAAYTLWLHRDVFDAIAQSRSQYPYLSQPLVSHGSLDEFVEAGELDAVGATASGELPFGEAMRRLGDEARKQGGLTVEALENMSRCDTPELSAAASTVLLWYPWALKRKNFIDPSAFDGY